MRGQPVQVELGERLSPFQRHLEAAFVLLELKPTDREGWRRALHNFRVTADRYVTSKRKRSHCPRKQ